MADNYTQFSFMLPCSEEEARKVVDVFSTAAMTAEEQDEDRFMEDFHGVDYEPRPDGIWVVDGEGGHGNIEAAINLVQVYLEMLRPNSCVIFEWANTCSKPRPGEFSGGGVLVTKEGVTVCNPAIQLKSVALKNNEQEIIET